MAEISNIHYPVSVTRTSQVVKPSDQKKDQHSRNEADNKHDQELDDDNDHIDEYA